MELQYFRLRQDKSVSNPIKFGPLDKNLYCYKMNQQAFNKLPIFNVAYYEKKIGLEFCDFLQAPMLMMSTKFQELFQLLEPQIEFKGIQVYPEGAETDMPVPVYWIPYLKETDCLHEASEIYGTGIAKTIVLKEIMLMDKPILKVKAPVEELWFVSLAAAECILRRQPLGVGLEPVKVRR